MVIVERSYDIAYVEDDDLVSGIFLNDDGMTHYSVRGEEVSRDEYKAWLDEQEGEHRPLLEQQFYAICN